MVDVAKGRGRPKGSGKDDSEPLMIAARFKIDDPKLTATTATTATTAMKRVLRTPERHRWPETDETLIRRWQVKWKAEGVACLQKVHDERVAAETERQRRERAAEKRRRGDHRPVWEIAAELRAAGHLPEWEMGNALRDAFAQHRDAMKDAASWRGDLESYRSAAAAGLLPDLGTFAGYRPPAAMTSAHLTVFDLMAEAKCPGSAMYEAMRAARGVLDSPGLAETLQKYGQMGSALRQAGEMSRTLADVSTLARLTKLPSGF